MQVIESLGMLMAQKQRLGMEKNMKPLFRAWGFGSMDSNPNLGHIYRL